MFNTHQVIVAATGAALVLSALAVPVLVLAALRLRSAAAVWWRRRREAWRRVRSEDTLKHVYHCELRGQSATHDSLVGSLQLRPPAAVRLIAGLEAQGLLKSAANGVTLTADGRQLALQVIRAHRLWERYLVDEWRMAIAEVTAEAVRREHIRLPGQLDALDAAIGHPAVDPHGDPIPTADGELAASPTRAITDWPSGMPARIVHLEDEPRSIFATIVATGLRLGQVIRVVRADAEQIVLSDGEREQRLSPIVAANVFVAAVDGEQVRSRPRLTELEIGQRATVHGLDQSLQGLTRRRLLDLGLTPGTSISAEISSLFGDPVAYRVRGALISLRREQAQQVLIDTKNAGVGDDV